MKEEEDEGKEGDTATMTAKVSWTKVECSTLKDEKSLKF